MLFAVASRHAVLVARVICPPTRLVHEDARDRHFSNPIFETLSIVILSSNIKLALPAVNWFRYLLWHYLPS